MKNIYICSRNFNKMNTHCMNKLAIIVFFVFGMIDLSAQELPTHTWTNPLTLEGEWSLYGIGDPYIMKYRGVYYLYCSTKDNNVGVKCWSTKDFITWSGPYMCTNEAITKTAYAPEVVYWNGTFYMYTSPGGNGHYVLTSESPTGPFTVVTGNLGKSIDGSIFIEDDGKWYFYHADNNGIMGCPMNSPTSIGTSFNLNAKMGYGWTEGPTVIKRNGVYYSIYTGNHVISKGYRIDCAQNTTGPVSSFTPQSAQNPILIKTEGSFVGLGHGSAFIGPDLDSYYYTYHNLAGDYGVGPYRRLNFDRMAWNGTKLLLLGPTTWAQQGFRQADMSDFFDRDDKGEKWLTPNGGNWTVRNRDMLVQDISDNETLYMALFEQPTESNYIAEFTVKEEYGDSEDARFGAVFGYTDDANFGIAVLNSHSNRMEINFKTNNVWETPRYYALPAGYNLKVWHHLRIEKSETTCKFFIDGMQKAAISHSLKGGKIGYTTSRCRANFGYIAFSNKVNGSGIFDIYKPIPGIIAAVHHNAGGEGLTVNCSDGGNATVCNPGDEHKYNVNVKKDGWYHLELRYFSAGTAQIRIWQGDTDLTGIVGLPATYSQTSWRSTTIEGLKLPAGFQTIKIETVNGSFHFYEMRFEEADISDKTLSDSFDTAFNPNWNYSDGNWGILSGEAEINGFGKRTIGNTGWTDYAVQVDVTYINTFNAGLIFRVNNPALGGAGNDPALGTDYLQGYFVTLSPNSVILGKHNYNWTQLAAKTGESYVTNKKYTLKVIVKGANIKVYVDDMETPKIDYTDTRPFICGKAGLRVCSAHARFDNFSIKSITPPPDPKTVSVDVQNGRLIAGSSTTFPVTTANIANGQTGAVTWYTSLSGATAIVTPTGITASVSDVFNNAATVTINTTTAATADTRYFRVTIDGVRSETVTLTVETLNSNEEQYASNLKVYPNPVKDFLYICHNAENTEFTVSPYMEIVDLNGRLIISQKDFSDKTIDVSKFAAGVYLLRLNFYSSENGETIVVRFTKE